MISIAGRCPACRARSRTVIEGMEAYDCTTAGRAIAAYVEELSNWYVRLSRRRFWEGDRAAFATLRHCLLDGRHAAGPLHAVPGRRDLREPGGRRGGGIRRRSPTPFTCCDFPEPDASLEDAELEAGVEAARRAVELGRAARAQAKVKVRQPLRKAVIVASGAEREAIERLGELVAGELNVKELEFVSEEAELVRYEVKPNYRALGPRFGKLMPKAAAAVEALDPATVAEAVARAREARDQRGRRASTSSSPTT